MLLFLVYMTYALFKVHGNSNINMPTTEALNGTRLAGTRFESYNYIKVQTIKLHCCNTYFKLTAVKFYLLGLLFTVYI
jgi:hypothetical protein